jgi:hypothetical protein
MVAQQKNNIILYDAILLLWLPQHCGVLDMVTLENDKELLVDDEGDEKGTNFIFVMKCVGDVGEE